jgi:hypothetical protein
VCALTPTARRPARPTPPRLAADLARLSGAHRRSRAPDRQIGAVRRRDHLRAAALCQGFAVWSGPAWPPIPEDAQTLAMAVAEALDVNTVETFLTFINANPSQRQQLLDLAGAAEHLEEVEQELASSTVADGPDSAGLTAGDGTHELAPTEGESSEAGSGQISRTPPAATTKPAPRVPLHRFEDLLIDGKVIRVVGVGQPAGTRAGASSGSGEPGGDSGDGIGGSHGSPRARAGTDLDELDRLGMRITFAFERRRFDGLRTALLQGDERAAEADVLIVDVSSPRMIAAAIEQSSVVKDAFEQLAEQGISQQYPGIDILTIKTGDLDRMIELKSPVSMPRYRR